MYIRAWSRYFLTYNSNISTKPYVKLCYIDNLGQKLVQFGKKNSEKSRDSVYSTVRKSAGIDLAVLSACNHTILSYGTFTFWAGRQQPHTAQAQRTATYWFKLRDRVSLVITISLTSAIVIYKQVVTVTFCAWANELFLRSNTLLAKKQPSPGYS